MRKIEYFEEKIPQEQSPIKYARKKLPTLWKEDSDIIILRLIKRKWVVMTFGGNRLNNPHETDVSYDYILESDGIVKKYIESFSGSRAGKTVCSIFVLN